LRRQLHPLGTSAFTDRDQLMPRAEKQRAIADGRRGHARLGQRMNALHGKSALCGHDKDIPHFTCEIEMLAVRHRRRGEALPELRETLTVMARAGLRIETRENTIVIARKEQAARRERRLHVAALTSLCP